MPNPGTFKGTRLTFLDAQADVYADGVRNNQLADTVADIQRRYFKRYPMSLEHNVEPTKEWLDSVDDSAPDPEVQAPDLESMSNEAYSEALAKFNSLLADTKARKDSIKRRLAYVYSKNCGKDASLDSKSKKGTSDPLTALKAKLAGVDLKAPRMRTPYNVWGPQNRVTVDPVYNKRVQEGNVPAKEQLALRSAVYKELFAELPEAEQKKWADIAKRDHERALEDLRAQEWQATSAVRSNADYQRVISALPAIMEPVLDLLCEYTGWKFSLQGGGPEPADGGRLNMIFMHSGVAPGSVSVDFGCAERDTFKKLIIPAFGRYMKKCYNKEACMARALPDNHGTATLADVRFEEGADVSLYRVEYDKSTAKAAPKKRLFELELEILNKGKGKAKPPTGTPSPMVRLGPPIGKPKHRMLPTKDNPASLLPGSSKVFKSSPLAQTVVTAKEVTPQPHSTPPLGGSESKSTAAVPIDAPVASDVIEKHPRDDNPSPGQTSTAADISSELNFEPPTAASGSSTDGSIKIPATSSADAIQLSESLTVVTPGVDTLAAAPGAAATSPGSDGAPSPPPSPVPSRSTSPVQSHPPSPPQVLPSRPTSCMPSRPTSPLQTGTRALSPAPSPSPVLSHPTSIIPPYHPSPLEIPEQALSPASLGLPSHVPSLPTLPVPSGPTSLLQVRARAPSPAPSLSPLPTPSRPTSPLRLESYALSPEPSSSLSPVPLHATSTTPSQPTLTLQSSTQTLSPARSRATSPLQPTAQTLSSVPLCPTSPVGPQAATPPLSCTTSPAPTRTASPLRNTPQPLSPKLSRSTSPLHPSDQTSVFVSANPGLVPAAPASSRTASPTPSYTASPLRNTAQLPSSAFSRSTSSLQASDQASASGPVSPGSALRSATSTSTASLSLPASDATSDPSSSTAPQPAFAAPPQPTSPPSQHSALPALSRPVFPLPLDSALASASTRTPPAPLAPWTSRTTTPLQPPSFSATPPGAATVPAVNDSEFAQANHDVETTPTPRPSKKRPSSKLASAQPPKKQRTGADFTRAFAISAVTDSPKWVSNAIDFLASEDMGATWRRLVELWVSFEAGCGFDEQGVKLLARGRPPVVAEWIKRARSPRYRPAIGSVAAFENAYALWWRSVQPDWRRSNGTALLKRADGEWGVIKCSGVNGLLSALAALFFWGVALGDSCADDVAWSAAVADAAYVLESII